MWIIKIVDSTATNTWWLGSSAKKLTEGYVHGLLSGDIEIHYELDVFTKQYSTPDVTLEFTNAPYRTVAGTSNYRSRLSDEWYNIKNATVKIYQDLGGATAIADCLQVFTGYVIAGASVSGGRISIRVVASHLKNVYTEIPQTKVSDISTLVEDRDNDKYLPIAYGQFVWNTRGEENTRKNNTLLECAQITSADFPVFAIADHPVGTPTKIYTKINDDLFEFVSTDWTYDADNALYLDKPTLTPVSGAKILPFLEYPMQVKHPREIFTKASLWDNSELGVVNVIDPNGVLAGNGYKSSDFNLDTFVVVHDSYDDGAEQYGLAYAVPLRSLDHPDLGRPEEWGVLLYAGSDIIGLKEGVKISWRVVRGATTTSGRQLFYDPDIGFDVVVQQNNEWNEPTFSEYRTTFLISQEGDAVVPYIDDSISFFTYKDVEPPSLELKFRRWRGAVKDGVKNNISLGAIHEARLACKYDVPSIDNLWVSCTGRQFGTWIDSGGRTNSFNAGDAIRSPAYIVESLLRDYAGLTTDQIDVASFDNANTDLTYPSDVEFYTRGAVMNFAVRQRKPVMDVVKEVLEETWLALIETPFGKMKVIDLWNTNPTITRTIPVSHIAKPGINLSRAGFFANEINVDVMNVEAFDTFSVNYVFKDLNSITQLGQSYTWKGQWPHLTYQSAVNLAGFLVGSTQTGQGFWSTEHVVIEFETVGGTNADLQIGDFISIDAGMDATLKCYGQSWSGRAFMVTAVTNLLDRTRLKCVELYNRLVPSSGGAVVTWSATEGTRIPTTDGAIVAWSATEGTRPFSVGEDAEFRVLAVLISEIYCGIELPSE